jgi:hypothetical protein
MTFIRPAIATALAIGAAMAAPATAPAAADSDIYGTYSFAADDGENATWTLTPCADDAPGCVRVSEAGNSKRAPWSGDAHWSVGSLILFVQQPDAILCEDGSAVPGRNTYSWDGATMSGSASIIPNGACGTKIASLSIPFKLTRIGAAEAQPPAAPTPPAPAPAPAALPAAPVPTSAPAQAAPAEAPPAAPPEAAPASTAPLPAESTAGPALAPPAPASAG